MPVRASILAALLALALWTTPAAGDPPGAALSLYVSGRYLAAADAAGQYPQSAQSLTLAARALLAACITSAEGADVETLLERAERAARAALQLEPRSVDARLQVALVLGMRGRRASLPEAFAQGYAPRGRRLINEALAIAPDHAEARAMLGAWHLEVLRRGGAMGAMTYGARLNDGLAAFDRARELAPSDPMIALRYAMALLELDANRYAVRARPLLEAVGAMAPRDALEMHGHVLAQRLLAALEQDGPRAASRLAHEASP